MRMRLALRLLIIACTAGAATMTPRALAVREWTFASVDGLNVVNGTAEIVTYRGRRAAHLKAATGRDGPADNIIAILADSDFTNGTIEADVAGAPLTDGGAQTGARGFIGIAFRVQPAARRYENLYLRPTNGRADDQLRRNHSVQYTSEPDFSFQRLRDESPGQYESYVDLEPGVWTHMRIVVSGRHAALYVNGATQPCLIVNDLKLGDTHGAVALWAHASTNAYFARVAIDRT
jgi:hypothetical protein